jgi:hypothetical protein
MLDSHNDADFAVGLGNPKILYSGSLILPLMGGFSLLKIISHIYPLSSVHVKSQSRTTMDACLIPKKMQVLRSDLAMQDFFSQDQ